MVDLSEEVLRESYRIPWLIWIQLLIMFLLALTIFLSYFSFFLLHSSHNNTDSPISSPSDLHSASIHRTQVSGVLDLNELDTHTATIAANRERRVENNSEREVSSSSAKDLHGALGSERLIDLCRYFELAKQAFLKCLGLGSTSRKSRGQHED